MKKINVQPNITIRQAMKILNKTAVKCLLVVDEKEKLIGTLSDGDIRKALLKGFSIGDKIQEIYNTNPTVLIFEKYTIKDAKKIFLKNKFDLIPVIDNDQKVVDILFWKNIFDKNMVKITKTLDVPTVIMTGGKGTRLEPFTKVLPKSLIPINGKPIIQYIIEKFALFNIHDFYLTINYKGGILKAFFQEFNSDLTFQFIEENIPLGTAGGLGYLKNKLSVPFFVTNCDVIIDTDYKSLYDFHIKNKYDITLVASTKEYIIPYGLCELNDNGYLSRINEKPKLDFLLNTGLYVLNPELLGYIPQNREYHFTELIKDAIERGQKVGVYPVHEEHWIDIGEWSEFRKTVNKLN